MREQQAMASPLERQAMASPLEMKQLLREAVDWIEKNGQEMLAEGAERKEPLPWSLRLDLQRLRREAQELLGKRRGQ
jgi:hypothetical protein